MPKIPELPAGVAVDDADLIPVSQAGVARKVTRAALVGTPAVDSDDVTYTPTTLADWDGSADPGDVEQALDQLADRVTDAEAAIVAGAVSDGDKGDVVVSSSGTVWTVENVTEAKQVLADNTTNDASTTKHGYAPKLTAPSSGLRNVMAIDNGETVLKNAALFDATNPADLGSAAPGSAMTAARRDHVHNTPGGGGGLTLVEHKVITSNSQTITFSGLDGDTDGVYLLIVKILNNSATTFEPYNIRPNGNSSNMFGDLQYIDPTTHAWGGFGTAGCIGFAAASTWMHSVVTINARQSINSIDAPNSWSGYGSSRDGSNVVYRFTFGGEWTAANAANMTSLDIVAGHASGVGNGSELFLYKLAQ